MTAIPRGEFRRAVAVASWKDSRGESPISKLGVVSHTSPSHVEAGIALGAEMGRRGHEVVVINVVDARERALAAGLAFRGLPEETFPLGYTAQRLADLGSLTGSAYRRRFLATTAEHQESAARALPELLKAEGVEHLLIDQLSRDGATAAQLLMIPYVTFCNALQLNSDGGRLPPFRTAAPYSRWPWARRRYRKGHAATERAFRAAFAGLNEIRAERGLARLEKPTDSDSDRAVIAQQPPCFEFPNRLPDTVHFTGPFGLGRGRPEVAFPWDALNGKPLVYASLGTIHGQKRELLRTIASACVGRDVQLVVSLGGSMAPDELGELPGSPLVVRFAPQTALLERAALMIGHAGLNSTLECLERGVPLVAIPLNADQPGIAARIRHFGVGELLEPATLDATRLGRAVAKVMGNPRYRRNAAAMSQQIRRSGGVTAAGDIVERALGLAAGVA